MVRKAKGPVKGRNKNEMQVAGVIIALFAVAVLLFMFFNNKEASAPTKTPLKSLKTVKAQPQVQPQPIKPYKPKVFPAAVVSTPKAGLPVKKPVAGSAGKIAFVLDDWGGSMRNCKYLKEIPDSLAIAILPGLKNTDNIAKCASLNNKVLMLHLPMEAMNNKDPYPTDYIIRTDMKPAKVDKILSGYLQKMPWVEGVNNHMGSKATSDPALMTVILKRLKKKGMFFLDSMTAHRSVCAPIAAKLNLPFVERDVFLDNVNTREAILKQITELAMKARANGSAIAIGHDRELTLRILKEQIPLLKEQGFEIVNVKSLLK